MTHESPNGWPHDDEERGQTDASPAPHSDEPGAETAVHAAGETNAPRTDEAQVDQTESVSPSENASPTSPNESSSASPEDEEDDYKGPLFPWEIEERIEELSPEERARKAESDRLLLTHYGVFYSVVSITALGLAEGLGIPGADTFLRGLMVGCLMAVLNLHLLAKACWGVLTGQRGMGSLAGFGLSFTMLMASAYWLVKHHPEWLLGFGFGLTLPVLVGFSYAFHLRKEAKSVR